MSICLAISTLSGMLVCAAVVILAGFLILVGHYTPMAKCPQCESRKTVHQRRTPDGEDEWGCFDCGKLFRQ